jgi:hypothetical protein
MKDKLKNKDTEFYEFRESLFMAIEEERKRKLNEKLNKSTNKK